MIESAAEANEELMNKYLEGGELSVDEIKAGLRQRTIASEIVPMMCGSAFKNKGVQAMLDAVIEYMPAPTDIPPVKGELENGKQGERRAADDEPFAGLAFKIMTDPYVGQLIFFRVYSGIINSGDTDLQPDQGHARSASAASCRCTPTSARRSRKCAPATSRPRSGLKEATTGDTLCDPEHVITLEKMIFPEPVIHVAVEPKTKADQEKMGIALNRLAQEDPSFRVRTDEESGQTIISGMGELHLEILVDRMKREFGVEANVGAPQVAYREAIRKLVQIEGKFIKQSGGRGQYGHVWLKMEPNEQGKGFEFVDAIKGGTVPREFIPAVEKGLKETLPNGVLAGLPGRRRQGHAVRRQLARRRLERERVQDGRVDRVQGRHAPGEPGAARADDGGRGRDARGLHGQRGRRPVVAARDDPGHGRPADRQGDQGRGAAGRDVRLLDDAALAVAGPRDLHDGIQALHRGAEDRSPKR